MIRKVSLEERARCRPDSKTHSDGDFDVADVPHNFGGENSGNDTIASNLKHDVTLTLSESDNQSDPFEHICVFDEGHEAETEGGGGQHEEPDQDCSLRSQEVLDV